MDNFKHNRKSIRASWWDYRWSAAYYVTTCTKGRKHFFGGVKDNTMILSGIGQIADSCWREITNHSRNVELGEYVVMPNHVHGILILHENSPSTIVGTGHALSLQSSARLQPGNTRFQNPGRNSLSSIVGGFKSAVSKDAHRAGFYFEWQSRFHDHIIRDGEEYQRISEYIRNNPARWKDDRFYGNAQ